MRFQSTRPIRGATDIHFIPVQRRNGFQSTRPIRGATLLLFCSRYPFDISIHAPHTGRDVAPNAIKPMPMDFNPRAPYGARPHRPSGRRAYRSISIHAPHTGRDMY